MAANRPIAVATSASAMPGRDGRQRHLLQVRQADERMHDSPHGAEQAHVGRDRADRGEEREIRLDRVELALEARAHRPAGAVEQRAGVDDALLAQLEELAHARREDALHRRARGLPGRVGVQVVEVSAGPELALELVVRGLDAAQAEQLAEDHRPARERREHEPGHDHLHDGARLQDERDDREVLVHRMACEDVVGDAAGLESSELDAADADRALGDEVAGAPCRLHQSQAGLAAVRRPRR